MLPGLTRQSQGLRNRRSALVYLERHVALLPAKRKKGYDTASAPVRRRLGQDRLEQPPTIGGVLVIPEVCHGGHSSHLQGFLCPIGRDQVLQGRSDAGILRLE